MRGYDNESRVWRGESNNGLFNVSLEEGTYFYSIVLEPGASAKSGFVILKKE